MKRERIKGIGKETPLLYAWGEQGLTYATIGKEEGLSRQGVKQRVDLELKKVEEKENLKQMIHNIIHDSKGNLYPYLRFDNHPQGKLLAFLARRYFGYHILDTVYCSLEKETISTVRTKMLDIMSMKNLPFALEDEDYGDHTFKNILTFGTFPAWNAWVDTYTDENGSTLVVAFAGKEILYNLCRWIDTDPEVDISEAFGMFSESYKKRKGIPTEEDLKRFIREKKNSVYNADKKYRKKILTYAGIGTGENRPGPKKKVSV